MNRTARTFLVIGIAVVLAGASTYLVYRTIQSRPTREVEMAPRICRGGRSSARARARC